MDSERGISYLLSVLRMQEKTPKDERRWLLPL
jgi:hypothetical protein